MKTKRYRLLSNEEIDKLDISDEQKDRLRQMRFDKSGKFVSLKQNEANYIETAYLMNFGEVNKAFDKRRQEELKRGGEMSVTNAEQWFRGLVLGNMTQTHINSEGERYQLNVAQAVQKTLRGTDFVSKEYRAKQYVAEMINKSRMFQRRNELGQFQKYTKINAEDLNYIIKKQDGKVVDRYWELKYGGDAYIIEERNSPYIIVFNKEKEYNLADYFNDEDVYFEYRNTFKRL